MAVAIRQMHESPTWPWRIAQPAKQAALSRSAFFERFSRAVGVAPMEYLFACRMALAKNLLRQEKVTSPKVAERVAYNAQSTFSIACTRYSDCRQRGMRGRDGIATPVRVHPSDIVARRVELVGLNDGSAFLLQLCLELRDKIARTLVIKPAEEGWTPADPMFSIAVPNEPPLQARVLPARSEMLTTLIAQTVRFARPNIQIYDAHVIDLYQ